MSEQIEDLHEDKPYDLDLIGNFGRFVSSGSYPVEFLMTSMKISQAVGCLKFARDLQMDDVDFELLMQRDIDEERVNQEIIPYLNRDSASAKSRPLFFPPLLVAALPVEDERIQNYYGPRTPFEPRANLLGRTWDGHFQIYGRPSSPHEGVTLDANVR